MLYLQQIMKWYYYSIINETHALYGSFLVFIQRPLFIKALGSMSFYGKFLTCTLWIYCWNSTIQVKIIYDNLFLEQMFAGQTIFLRNFHLKCPRSPLIFGYLETTSRLVCLLHPDVRHSTHSVTEASIPVPHRDPSITFLHSPALHSWKPNHQHEKVYVAEAGVNVRGRGGEPVPSHLDIKASRKRTYY